MPKTSSLIRSLVGVVVGLARMTAAVWREAKRLREVQRLFDRVAKDMERRQGGRRWPPGR